MSALVPMPALSDLEDSPPHFRSTMPDNETLDTMAPPTDREAPTQTENPKPHRDAVNPPPAGSPSPATADSIFSDAVRQIVDAASVIRAEREARRQFEEAQLDMQRQTLAAIERADRNADANWRATQHQIDTWRKVDNAKNAEQDDRLAALEAKFVKLEADIVGLVQGALTEQLKPILEEFDEIKRAIEDLKNGTARTPEATPAT